AGRQQGLMEEELFEAEPPAGLVDFVGGVGEVDYADGVTYAAQLPPSAQLAGQALDCVRGQLCRLGYPVSDLLGADRLGGSVDRDHGFWLRVPTRAVRGPLRRMLGVPGARATRRRGEIGGTQLLPFADCEAFAAVFAGEEEGGSRGEL